MFKHCLIVFLVSMVPIIELRGAIPYGVGFGLPLWLTYIIAIVGNMLPVPLIYFFARKVLEWGRDKPVIGKFFTFCLENGQKGRRKAPGQGRAGAYSGRCCCLWASPCPARGPGPAPWPPACWIWTSAAALLACMGGVLLAGCIMGALSLLGVSAFGAIAG